MKKVRFESPIKVFNKRMDDLECHSPRPFLDKQETHRPDVCDSYPRLLPYNPDPVLRYENSNCSPYPAMSRTSLGLNLPSEPHWSPSNDLNLSMLDGSSHEPRKPTYSNQPVFLNHGGENVTRKFNKMTIDTPRVSPLKVLSSIENTNFSKQKQSTKHIANNNFFIRRDNLNELNLENINPLQNQLNRLSLNKDNVSLAKQAEMMRLTNNNVQHTKAQTVLPEIVIPRECRCHHCVKIIQNGPCYWPKPETNYQSHAQTMHVCNAAEQHECISQAHHNSCHCINCVPVNTPNVCDCNRMKYKSAVPQNAVDKKTWMLQKYEQNNEQGCMEVEKQENVVKEKREPTVSDLFKIIKLQNEQLQLLQEKVDKFICASNNKNIDAPVQNYMTEHVAFESAGNEQHKISIGVMTSFEMVRTSTVINKEYVTQTNEGAQIQCNRSQISIKEVVSEAQPGNLNFLDGIMPVGKANSIQRFHCSESDEKSNDSCDLMLQTANVNDDKTLNEMSLYNVHVDNATTPLLSPEQSLYLDVRDYSDSDSSSDSQSNVGWTYYNKVMTHVNGMLQDSDMPSSASALYRNTHQRCVQMKIDKTNVSVTKRVKFGDDPLGVHQQPHIYAASTDTSIKMNQLAAKYLKAGAAASQPPVPVPKETVMPIEMSFATRNYMERHRILQGGNVFPSQSPPVVDMPRFLDITALKKQPKFL